MWTINNNQILKDGLLIATVVNRELIYERCLRIPINILTQANVHPIIIKRIREDDSKHEYKMQAIKSAKELGDYAKATTELGISKNTLYSWMKAVREGRLSIGENEQSTFSQSEVTLNEELVQLLIFAEHIIFKDCIFRILFINAGSCIFKVHSELFTRDLCIIKLFFEENHLLK